ncbi:glyceraldehyde dehydrogenase subunit beta [Kribbella yunnanensis]|uniref:Glyceraldehyde dehydrogenase subunit beta n=1 Tax=Kribbella yunnanensis TaxID=190194 RepID=A0ABP4UZH5_9ACTN
MPSLLFEPSDYQFASSLDDVLDTLAREGDKARIIAGGTTIHELAYRKGMGDVRTLVDVTRLPMGRITESEGRVSVGATVTFTELAAYARARHPKALAIVTDAIAGIRPMQIRNVGTVGGAVCSSLPFFDLPAALVALDAKVTVNSRSKGERSIPIEEFFWDFFLPDLRPDELLTAVDFAVPRAGTAGAFQKFESNSVDWALVSIGVQVTVVGGRFLSSRVALGGGIGRKVTRASTVENALDGCAVTDEHAIDRAAAGVVDDVRAFSDFRGSAKFRNHLLKTYIARCLHQAARRTQ